MKIKDIAIIKVKRFFLAFLSHCIHEGIQFYYMQVQFDDSWIIILIFNLKMNLSRVLSHNVCYFHY